METVDLTWTTPKNIPIFAREWIPDLPPRGVIILVHGIGEHLGRYNHVAEMYSENHYAFIASDLTGHGKSGGQRGHVDSFEDFFDQIHWMIQTAIKQFPGAPVFLYGHSLGAGIVLKFLETGLTSINGAILTSPPLVVNRVPFLKRWMGNMMYRIYPRMAFTNSLDLTGLSHDESVVKNYKADPLVHNLVSARLGIDLLNISQDILNNQSKITVPILLMHGSADRLVNVTGSQEFARQYRGELKYVEIPEGYHELHNEPNKQDVFKVWLDWLDEKIRSGAN